MAASPFSIDPSQLALYAATMGGFGGQGGQGGMASFDPSMFLDPRQRMRLQTAQGMMQEGVSTAPVHSAFGGLARLAGAILGRNMVGGYDNMFGGTPAAQPTGQGSTTFDDWGNMIAPKGTPERKVWDDKTDAQKTMWVYAHGDKLLEERGSLAGQKVQQEGQSSNEFFKSLTYYQNEVAGNPKIRPELLPLYQADLAKKALDAGFQANFDQSGNVHAVRAPGGPADIQGKATEAGAIKAATAPYDIAVSAATNLNTPIASSKDQTVTTPAMMGMPGGGLPAAPTYNQPPLNPPAGGQAPGGAAAPTGGPSPTGAPSGPAATGGAPGAPPAPATPVLPASPAAATSITPPPPPPPAATAATAAPPPPPPPVQAAPPPLVGPPPPPPYGVAPPPGAGPAPGAAPSPGGFGGRDFAGSIPQARFPAAAPPPYGAPPMVGAPPPPPPMAAPPPALAPSAAIAPGAPPLTQTAPPADKGPQVVPPPPPLTVADLPAPPKPGTETMPPAMAAAETAAAPPMPAAASGTMPAPADSGGAQAGGPGAAGAATAVPPSPPVAAATAPAGNPKFDQNDPLKGIDPTPPKGAATVPDLAPLKDASGRTIGFRNTLTSAGGDTTTAASEQFKADTARNTAAQQLMGNLDTIQHDFDMLNQHGWTGSGPQQETKMELLKTFNGVLQTLGMKGVDEDAVADYESAKKVATRLGFDLSGGVGSGAHQIVETALAAVPHGELSPRGNQIIIEGLRQAAQRQIDLYQFKSAYSVDPRNVGGSLATAQDKFDKAYPPSLYSHRAIYNTIPPESVTQLQKTIDAGQYNPASIRKRFDDQWGKGMAEFALNGG